MIEGCMENTSMKGQTGMSGIMGKDQKTPSPECVMRPTQLMLLEVSDIPPTPRAPPARTPGPPRQRGQLNINFHVIVTLLHCYNYAAAKLGDQRFHWRWVEETQLFSNQKHKRHAMLTVLKKIEPQSAPPLPHHAE